MSFNFKPRSFAVIVSDCEQLGICPVGLYHAETILEMARGESNFIDAETVRASGWVGGPAVIYSKGLEKIMTIEQFEAIFDHEEGHLHHNHLELLDPNVKAILDNQEAEMQADEYALKRNSQEVYLSALANVMAFAAAYHITSNGGIVTEEEIRSLSVKMCEYHPKRYGALGWTPKETVVA
jgi:hypothetical protein